MDPQTWSVTSCLYGVFARGRADVDFHRVVPGLGVRPRIVRRVGKASPSCRRGHFGTGDAGGSREGNSGKPKGAGNGSTQAALALLDGEGPSADAKGHRAFPRGRRDCAAVDGRRQEEHLRHDRRRARSPRRADRSRVTRSKKLQWCSPPSIAPELWRELPSYQEYRCCALGAHGSRSSSPAIVKSNTSLRRSSGSCPSTSGWRHPTAVTPAPPADPGSAEAAALRFVEAPQSCAVEVGNAIEGFPIAQRPD